MRIRAAALGVLVLALCPTPARADGDIWTRAAALGKKDAVDGDALHRMAARMLVDAENIGGPMGSAGGTAIASLSATKQMLVYGGARTSGDVRLRFDLGMILSRLRDCGEAIPVLKSALALSPKHPRAATAWFEVATCSAMLGKRDLEVPAYVKVLELEDSPGVRALVLGNLAEARMGLGQLDLAMDAIDEAIATVPDEPMFHWTSAVVRDRGGDPAGALAAAKIAVSLDPKYDRLHDTGVFWVPDYDGHWYDGLGELAHAELSKGDEKKASNHMMAALVHFHAWVDAAPETDRFRPLGVDRVEQIEKRMGIGVPPKSKNKK
jgi:tetratricopeptide (TPR) repeat protein